MKLKYIILIFIFCYQNILSQDPKKITDQFFPDLDIHAPTPALSKKKGFTNYKELLFFLDELKNKNPSLFNYKFIGKSQKGKEIPMVFIGDSSKKNIKICYMAGLHGNEPAIQRVFYYSCIIYWINSLSGLYINLAIIPMANIDGYEKQSRYAANGQDLNRDQTKLSNPEMNAIKKAINNFSPEVMVDFHEYKPYRVDFVKFGEYGTTSMYDCMFLYSGNLNVCPLIKETIEDKFLPIAQMNLTSMI